MCDDSEAKKETREGCGGGGSRHARLLVLSLSVGPETLKGRFKGENVERERSVAGGGTTTDFFDSDQKFVL